MLDSIPNDVTIPFPLSLWNDFAVSATRPSNDGRDALSLYASLLLVGMSGLEYVYEQESRRCRASIPRRQSLNAHQAVVSG